MRNKFKCAVGLSYCGDRKDSPSVELKGERVTADSIVKIARRYGVPVVVDEKLASSLNHLDEGDKIPERLFEPVAVILHKILNLGRKSMG